MKIFVSSSSSSSFLPCQPEHSFVLRESEMEILSRFFSSLIDVSGSLSIESTLRRSHMQIRKYLHGVNGGKVAGLE